MGRLISLHRPPLALEGLSDEVLLSQCARGASSADAMAVLFDRHAEPARRFLCRMTHGHSQDVPDLLQATFVEVQSSAPRFRFQSAVRTWILSIAANVVRHHHRAERRRSSFLRAFSLAVAARPPNAGDENETRDLLGRLARALEGLPHDLRVVFVMSEMEEIPGREVAQALGIREGTVWKRLHQARRHLRQALEGGHAP